MGKASPHAPGERSDDWCSRLLGRGCWIETEENITYCPTKGLFELFKSSGFGRFVFAPYKSIRARAGAGRRVGVGPVGLAGVRTLRPKSTSAC